MFYFYNIIQGYPRIIDVAIVDVIADAIIIDVFDRDIVFAMLFNLLFIL